MIIIRIKLQGGYKLVLKIDLQRDKISIGLAGGQIFPGLGQTLLFL
jgi:hypothetical protein